MSKLRTLKMACLAFIVLLAIGDAALAPAPAPRQPDFIDTVFASRAVVVAIRIAIVFAAGFVVLSVVALIVRQQWLTRVGPVEVSDLGAENQRLECELDEVKKLYDNLRQKVSQMIDAERSPRG